MKTGIGNTFVVGDIHGAHKALVQCLERSGFDNETDTLISLGDIADGWSEVYECVEELLKIKNLIAIKGNHDDWALEMMQLGSHPSLEQGGKATRDSYEKHWREGGEYFPESHLNFFKYQHLYYIDAANRMYVHGGFNRHFSVKEQYSNTIFYWDRDLWMSALSYERVSKSPSYIGGPFKIKDNFTSVFIGHTTTVNWSMNETVGVGGIVIPGNVPCTIPMQAANIFNLDTGAGFKGKLTIMDVDTKQYWQSDPVQELYPNERGRG